MQLFPPLFDAPARGIPSEFLDETYPTKTRGMRLLYSENCMTVFDWSTRVTDRQTDGFAIAYSALIMLSRAKKLTRCRNWCWCLYRRQYVQLTWGNGNEYCISFVIQFSCSVHANNTRTCRYPGNCIHICALGLDELYVSYRYVLHADCCW